MLVYALTNVVNGKAYVGQHTGFRLEKRWSKNLSSRNKTNRHLASAIAKYGAHNFGRTILCYATCQEELNLLERFFISVFRSSDPKFGYNKTLGGEPARQFTKEIRATLSKSMRREWRRGTHRNHGRAVRRWWRNLSKAERRLIKLKQSLGRRGQTIKGHRPWNKGKRGIPSGRKGRTFGKQQNPCRKRKPFTEKHKERISRALKRFHKLRRQAEGSSR